MFRKFTQFYSLKNLEAQFKQLLLSSKGSYETGGSYFIFDKSVKALLKGKEFEKDFAEFRHSASS